MSKTMDKDAMQAKPDNLIIKEQRAEIERLKKLVVHNVEVSNYLRSQIADGLKYSSEVDTNNTILRAEVERLKTQLNGDYDYFTVMKERDELREQLAAVSANRDHFSVELGNALLLLEALQPAKPSVVKQIFIAGLLETHTLVVYSDGSVKCLK